LRNVDREILGEYDHNRNGVIDRDEMREVPWGDDPGQDDTNRDGRLTREELAGRIARRWGFGAKQPAAGLVVQYGQQVDERRREWGDRDRRNREDDGGGEERRERGRREGGGGDDEQKYRNYADGVVRSYDKNGDRALTPDEWDKSKISEKVRAADKNRDNRVDGAELAAYLAQDARREGDGGGERPRRSESSNATAGSLRFDTAHERLPKGVPPWFIEKDTSADGQVSMAEYSSNWNDTVYQEFARYDGNDDGIITADESLRPRPAGSPPANSTAAAPAARPTSDGPPPRMDRAERGERPERGERSDRPDRNERRGRRNSYWAN
jgi:hypothetical protein